MITELKIIQETINKNLININQKDVEKDIFLEYIYTQLKRIEYNIDIYLKDELKDIVVRRSHESKTN